MRIAYADPPYIGQAKARYGNEPSYAGEVDHQQLIRDLTGYDGWALSCSSPTLGQILSWAPKDARVGAWVKPFAVFKPNVNPAYAWEPVVFKPARSGKDRIGGRKAPTIRDWVSASITLKRGLCGVKPEGFCMWIFDLLGMTVDDTLVDLFPGSGAVTQAWEKWCARS